jgi:GrpB-like predicted nucleotidyltransferase (UPF0157 family)
MGGPTLRIENLGSTSVPGIAAKPVTCIRIAVASRINGRRQ